MLKEELKTKDSDITTLMRELQEEKRRKAIQEKTKSRSTTRKKSVSDLNTLVQTGAVREMMRHAFDKNHRRRSDAKIAIEGFIMSCKEVCY